MDKGSRTKAGIQEMLGASKRRLQKVRKKGAYGSVASPATAEKKRDSWREKSSKSIE